MSQQENMQAQQQFGEAINSGNLNAMRDLVAPNCVDHDPGPTQVPGPEGYIALFTEMRTAFPDLAVAVDHLVADDDNIAFAYTVTGTHSGDFMGHAPTGRKISARGMQISRFENGKMVERWGSSDQLGILQQIGAAPK
jgi:steroid delta-isomerase-like uncharacterized protein